MAVTIETNRLEMKARPSISVFHMPTSMRFFCPLGRNMRPTLFSSQVSSEQLFSIVTQHFLTGYHRYLPDRCSPSLKLFTLKMCLTLVSGWHGVEISGFKSGESIAVFGAGPVGLMAAYSATLRGASRVFVVDRVPERLAAAQKIGCIPIDFTKVNTVEEIIRLNDGMVDRSVDAVGYQAVDKSGSSEKPNIVLENMISVTRACGGMGIPGLYVPRYVVFPVSNPSNTLTRTVVILGLPMKPPPMAPSVSASGNYLKRYGSIHRKSIISLIHLLSRDCR